MATATRPLPLLDDLRALVHGPGPFASVYLPAPSTTIDAPERLEVQWHNARRALEQAGAPSELLETLNAPATADHGAGEIRCLVATPDGDGSWKLAVDTWMDGELASPIARYGPVPHLVPLLDERRRRVAHVTVLIDRVGADITSAGAELAAEADIEVEGETQDIARSAPGGWSQRRFQQRAENTWEDNARGVADEVAHLARAIDARFVAVAGDVRATAFLVEHLPDDVAAEVITIDGSRHDHAGVSDEVDHIAADHAARRSVAILHDLADHVGTERGTTDVASVLQALRRHQVETLVVATGAAADHTERTAYVSGSDRSQVALGRDELVDAGDDAVPADLDDAAIAAALVTGADVVVVPATTRLVDGLGAMLRF
ncbi:MAG: Vms1/Ankzf1 family peptidyl-tRNA hydrolase [Acidimicrobiales bacterium]